MNTLGVGDADGLEVTGEIKGKRNNLPDYPQPSHVRPDRCLLDSSPLWKKWVPFTGCKDRGRKNWNCSLLFTIISTLGQGEETLVVWVGGTGPWRQINEASWAMDSAGNS